MSTSRSSSILRPSGGAALRLAMLSHLAPCAASRAARRRRPGRARSPCGSPCCRSRWPGSLFYEAGADRGVALPDLGTSVGGRCQHAQRVRAFDRLIGELRRHHAGRPMPRTCCCPLSLRLAPDCGVRAVGRWRCAVRPPGRGARGRLMRTSCAARCRGSTPRSRRSPPRRPGATRSSSSTADHGSRITAVDPIAGNAGRSASAT